MMYLLLAEQIITMWRMKVDLEMLREMLSLDIKFK